VQHAAACCDAATRSGVTHRHDGNTKSIHEQHKSKHCWQQSCCKLARRIDCALEVYRCVLACAFPQRVVRVGVSFGISCRGQQKLAAAYKNTRMMQTDPKWWRGKESLEPRPKLAPETVAPNPVSLLLLRALALPVANHLQLARQVREVIIVYPHHLKQTCA